MNINTLNDDDIKFSMAQSTHSTSPVLIIGAGISGLALAQGLRLRSVPFRLFERHAQSHSAQGHRFRISPESVTALSNILLPQCKDLFQRTAAERVPFQPRYVDAKKYEFETPSPFSEPQSMPVDRTWLRKLMTLGLEDAIEYEKEFASYQVLDNQVHVSFTDGSSAQGRFLVGADGVKSRVRKQLQPNRRLLDLERWIMWGRTLLTEDLRKHLSADHLTWYMALDKEANVQVVVEPMTWTKSVKEESDNRLPDYEDYLYFALCTAPGQDLPKTVEAKKEFLTAVTKDWHPTLKLIFDETSHDRSACVPVLSSKPDIEIQSSTQKGKVALLGDSAHAMSPMGGSGGTTAILNVADLVETIADEGITPESIRKFEERMSERAREKIEHSFRGGMKFWKGAEWFEYQEVDV